jgi:hypothetical protein
VVIKLRLAPSTSSPVGARDKLRAIKSTDLLIHSGLSHRQKVQQEYLKTLSKLIWTSRFHKQKKFKKKIQKKFKKKFKKKIQKKNSKKNSIFFG